MAKDDTRSAGFVDKIVQDPGNPPAVRMLSGWFGKAGEEGYTRLYTDPTLASYVDIPDDAILATEPLENVQPPGCQLVWVSADAKLKPGGTTASRAGRFLQGAVTRDYSSPEKAGYRCVTQTPCGEPTGFTGQCTKQPEVGGGGWPCITALPLCSAEPTGFTGQCTDQPWPNPTRYLGCTVLHCPTYDLTHQPHICNMIASGIPGCGGGIPQPKGGEEQSDEAGAADTSTRMPGCGYTQIWGLCDTHKVNCGFMAPPKTETKGCVTVADAGGPGIPVTEPQTQFYGCTAPPTALCTQDPKFCPTFCGPECQTPQPNCTSMNCTQVGPNCPPHTIGIACTAVPPCPQPTPLTIGPRCTAIPECGEPADAARAAGPGGGGPVITLLTYPVWQCSPTPATRCFICPPLQGGQTAATVCTQYGQQCLSAVDACPTRFGCGGGGGGGQTAATVCTQYGQQCQSAVDACPTRFGCGGVEQFARGGAAAAAGPGGFGVTAWLDCTQFGPQCGQFFTLFAVECQVFDPWATRIGPQCFTIPPQCPRTVIGCPPPTPFCPPPTPFCPPTPVCPPQSRLIVCTVFGPQCGGGGTIVGGETLRASPPSALAWCGPTKFINCTAILFCA